MTGLVLFAASFLYYGLRATEGPAWLDGSELVATGHLLAVPHPTGAPIYLVLVKLSELLLPFGPPAVRAAWLSALFAALAVERFFAIATWLCTRVGSSARLPPFLAAALFALTPGLLAIGHRAELYSLQLFLALTALRLALTVRERGQAGHARLGGLVIGLAAATHPYLTALFVPGLVLCAGRPLLRPRLLAGALGFVLLGGAAYGLLALRGRAGGLIGWGDATSFSGWLDILLGRAFQKGFSAPLAGSAADSLLLFTVTQFGEVGGLLLPVAAFAGLVVLVRKTPVVAGGLVLLVVFGLASRALWPFDHATPDTAGYFALPVAIVFALFAVLLARVSAMALPRPAPIALTTAAALGLGFSLGLPRSRELEGNAGRELALRALAPLEKDALVVLDDFNLLFMTWYLQAVEGVRPDLQIVFGGFLSQPWYQRRLAHHAPRAAERWQRLAAGLEAPIYVDYGIGAGLLPPPVREGLEPVGLLFRAGPGAPPSVPMEKAWMLGRSDLDPQTRRALVWLHFRHACFAHEKGQRTEVDWHAREVERLHPGVGLGDALVRTNGRICQGG